MKPFLRIALFGALALAGAALAGCTASQEQAALAGVQAACAISTAASNVEVQIASNQSADVQSASKEANTDVTTACPALVTATQTAVNAITASGGTATVTVTSTTPAPVTTAAGPTVALKKRVIAKVVIRGVGVKRKLTFVVKPAVGANVPLVGKLIGKLGL
jgi:hypothetical protein